MRIDPIKELIDIVQKTEFSDVKQIANVAMLNYDSYRDQGFFVGVFMYTADIVDGLVGLKNGPHTAFSVDASDDIGKLIELLYHAIFRDNEHILNAQLHAEQLVGQPESAIEGAKLQNCQDIKDSLLAHYRETFVGKQAYVPLESMPVMEWAMAEGNFRGRLELFKTLYFYNSTNQNDTRH